MGNSQHSKPLDSSYNTANGTGTAACACGDKSAAAARQSTKTATPTTSTASCDHNTCSARHGTRPSFKVDPAAAGISHLERELWNAGGDLMGKAALRGSATSTTLEEDLMMITEEEEDEAVKQLTQMKRKQKKERQVITVSEMEEVLTDDEHDAAKKQPPRRKSKKPQRKSKSTRESTRGKGMMNHMQEMEAFMNVLQNNKQVQQQVLEGLVTRWTGDASYL